MAKMTPFDVPPTQNTAPVLDYRCMFTPDIRKKQKKWQDGQLKFHTFNKRIMVYDERSNLVGDTHWREDELYEGAELELDRRGILVEVGEYQEQHDQDLTELIDKRRKDREDRSAAKSAATPARPSMSFMHGHTTPSGNEALRPKPLNELLGPSGHYGRAVVSSRSPFDEKQHQAGRSTDENERPGKRRKLAEEAPSKNGYAQNLMGTALNLTSSRPPSIASLRHEPLRLKSIVPPKTMSIDLTADSDEGDDTLQRDIRRKEDIGKTKRSRIKSPPAKSGYASNLTGAALSLSASAPISSRQHSGRLAPVKVAMKPSLPRRMDPEEDLSSAAEDYNIVEMDHTPPSPAPNVKRKKNMGKHAKARGRETLSEAMSSSPVREEESSMVNEFSRPKFTTTRRLSSSPAPRAKERPKEPLESTKPRKSKKATLSTDLHDTQSRKHADKVPSSKQETTQKSLAIEPTPERPTSSLRIRARPPRRKMMMMVMGRSSSSLTSGPVAPGAARSKSTPKPAGRLESTGNEIVMSQATLELEAFCQKQEEKINAPLNGLRSKAVVGESSSSPIDSGIDHHKIELLLYRKSELEDLGAAKVHSRVHQHHPASMSAFNTGQRIVPGKARNSDKSLISGKPVSVSKQNNNLLLDEENLFSSDFGYSPDVTEKPLPQSRGKNSASKKYSELDEAHESELSGVQSDTVIASPKGQPILHDLSSSPRSIQVQTSEHNIQESEETSNYDETRIIAQAPAVSIREPAKDQQTRETNGLPRDESSNIVPDPKITSGAKETHQSRLQTSSPKQNAPATNLHLPATSPVIIGKTKLPEHMIAAIQGATEHFMSKIRPTPPAKPQDQKPEPEAGSPISLRRDLQESAPAPAPEIVTIQSSTTDHKNESMSSIINIKASPHLSAIQLDMPESEIQQRIPEPVVEKPLPHFKPPQPRIGVPRPRLQNPATGGRSLRSIAANTADLAAPQHDTMAPPPALGDARQIGRVNRTNSRDGAIAAPAPRRAEVREEVRGGPWSRESFDLFGSYRPPGREAGAVGPEGVAMT